MVNGLSDEDRHPFLDLGRIPTDGVGVSPRIRIELFHDFALATVTKSQGLGCEAIDVLVGPFNLFPDAAQIRRSGHCL
jgi:hypothetical protein